MWKVLSGKLDCLCQAYFPCTVTIHVFIRSKFHYYQDKMFNCAKFSTMDILKIRCMSQMGKNKLVAAGTDKVLNDSALQKMLRLSLDNGKSVFLF